MEHLFVNCCVWRTIAVHVCDLLNIKAFSPAVLIADMIKNWISNLPRNSYLLSLPLHMMWIFWKARNRTIFEGEKRTVFSLIQQVISTVKAFSSCAVTKKRRERKIGRAWSCSILVVLWTVPQTV